LALTFDQLALEIHPTRAASGHSAGTAAAAAIRAALAEKGSARVVFAAAPSQNETLETLADAPGIRWQNVAAFHMDEYIGLDAGAPQRFAKFLDARLFEKLPFGAVNRISCAPGEDPREVCAAYARLLDAAPVDVVCLGIGENGHLAFNDPPADFNDPLRVKVVTLDEACRQQQVNDGCFPNLGAVPRQAVTLTIPALLSAACLICTVPGPRKHAAVRAALLGEISGDCPASILRTHPNVTMYVDRACWEGN
jgi:glucosamine-6-phosphate deaminase